MLRSGQCWCHKTCEDDDDSGAEVIVGKTHKPSTLFVDIPMEAPKVRGRSPRRDSRTFVVEVDGQGHIGLQLQKYPDRVMVEKVLDGPICEWNQTHPEQEVRPRDVVLSVNNVSGNFDDMKSEFETIGNITIKFVRSEFEVVIEKKGKKLGLDLKKREGVHELVVECVRTGFLCDEWNTDHQDCKIMEGDVAVKVNETHNSVEILDRINQDDKLTMVFRIPGEAIQ